MPPEEPCCPAVAAKMIKKLTLPDGFQVGILNLESILKEVAELKLADAEAIKKELLKRVRIHNYVASGAEDDYSEALFKEYGRQFGKSK
ncbi:hypothetical protein ACFLWY_00290 [Chloroflexota bacterium]